MLPRKIVLNNKCLYLHTCKTIYKGVNFGLLGPLLKLTLNKNIIITWTKDKEKLQKLTMTLTIVCDDPMLFSVRTNKNNILTKYSCY